MKKVFTGIAVLLTLTAGAQDTTGQYREAPVVSPFSFEGSIEAYYAYDFNRPENNLRPYFLYSHNRHHEFTVNLAYMKTSYRTARVRAALALAAGTYMNANYATEPGVFKHLYEAYAGYQLLAAKNLWLDMGILPSHIGFESAHAPSCWTLTRSMAAENSPYYEAGARLTYTSNSDVWLFSVLALNGWQRIHRVEGNLLMSWGTQVQFRKGKKVSLNYSTFLGTDQPDTGRKWRYFHDLYILWQATGQIGLLAGCDQGWQQKAKNSREMSAWLTPVGILRFAPVEQWSFALRGEYYRDAEGVIIATGTPHGFRTTGFSANVDYRPQKNVALRLEGRTLHSQDAIFTRNNRPRNTNTAITFSMGATY